jgi:adenine C2-methylase RlmN of 23S rRNA A2503 and tRNA A37
MRVFQRHDLVFGPGIESRKYLFAFLFRGGSRGLCCSAQAGCTFACRHCATTYAPRPFLRNLSAEEIVAIVAFVVEDSNLGHPLDFLDFSGVGDCSANWVPVLEACKDVSRRDLASTFRLTTVGPRQWCERVAGDLKVFERVVISLHGADKETRRQIIPNAEDPWKAAAWWSRLAKAGPFVDLNYVVHQHNSSPQHLDALARFVTAHSIWIRELRLSTINPIAGMPFWTPETFPQIAARMRPRLPSAVRLNAFTSIGRSASMACGQLRALRDEDIEVPFAHLISLSATPKD